MNKSISSMKNIQEVCSNLRSKFFGEAATVTFECKRKPNEAESEQLLTELKDLPSNALDIGYYSDLKNRIIEEGIFTLWWD